MGFARAGMYVGSLYWAVGRPCEAALPRWTEREMEERREHRQREIEWERKSVRESVYIMCVYPCI